ncbi:GNAT family N-acetyltransferase, partial [Staphylococcus epidermidis]|uniref:GNAT family N-acetyltransferase n=1 Tax=Staphylococcus epidermidis TaxID=1282 RepID=UPI0028CB8C31
IELSILNLTYRSFYHHISLYHKHPLLPPSLIPYPPKHQIHYQQQSLNLPLQEHIIHLPTPLPQKESYDHEIYIQTLLTSPKYPPQRIPTQLLNYLISTHPHEKCGFNSHYHNNKPPHLYHKLPFKHHPTIHLYPHQYFHITFNNN